MNKRSLMLIASVLIVGMILGGAFMAQYGSMADINNKLAVDNPSGQPAYMTTAASVNIGPTNIADMVEQVSPAVVNIEAYVTVTTSNPLFYDPFFREFFGRRYPGSQSETQTQKSIGTGSIITDSGYILTNYHVVEGATSVSVKVIGFSESLKATVVGYDDTLDLAVLKLNVNKKLPYLRLGDSDSIRVGDWVVAIGNPYGLDHTVTVGVISAKERPITIENRTYKHLIQTDAAINPGNSGGPLLNTSGQVIGINTAVNAEAQGIGFAIPINTAREVLDQMINKGKVSRPYIGIHITDITSSMANTLGLSGTEGALVTEIVDGSPAVKAGIRPGDVVLSINGNKVKDSSDLTDKVQKYKINEKVTLQIMREGKIINVNVTLEEKP